ncbi:MAG: GNAT family N-acetyltransferase [Verrucomicrobiota bacterium]
MNFRPAQPEDVVAIHALLLELAEFEKITDWVEATEMSTREALFGKSPAAEALVAESPDDEIVATAIYFQNYSTFVGRPGLYLEDIYVKAPWRGQGIGRNLLHALATIAAERGCGRMEWSVLDWNQPAIDFYEGLGAQILHDWRLVRLGKEGIARLANDT